MYFFQFFKTDFCTTNSKYKVKLTRSSLFQLFIESRVYKVEISFFQSILDFLFFVEIKVIQLLIVVVFFCLIVLGKIKNKNIFQFELSSSSGARF